MRRIEFTEAEIAEEQDHDRVGIFSVEGDEHIVGGLGGYPNHWTAFTVSKVGATIARITPGRLFKSEIIYASEAQIDVNTILHMPGISPNRRWLGLVAQGEQVTVNEQRLVETDVDTGETTLMAVPKVVDCKVNIVPLFGNIEIADNPTLPEVPEGQCLVAWVLLGVTGILDIVPGTAWRVKNLYEVEGRVTTLELELNALRQRTAQTETDIANLAGQLRNIPRPEIMRMLKRDAAATRKRLNMPDEARAYWYDQGLLQDDWDKANANWLARVEEGIRFGYAAIVDNQMSLINGDDPAINVTGNMLLPAWSEVAKIVVDGNSTTFRDISSQVHTETTVKKRTVSGVKVSYGPTVNVCENAQEWDIVKSKHVGETFQINGTTYISDGLANGPNQSDTFAGGMDFATWNSDPNTPEHKVYAIRSVKRESWTKTYWDTHIKEYGVNGSIYGNSFLNSQTMICPSIELKFTRVGTADVQLFLCECDSTGAPVFDAVVGHASKAANQISVGWVKFDLDEPVLLEPGQRYAWYTVTVGNHALADMSGNKFAQGSQFWATDGAWAFGDPQRDFLFKVNSCKFISTRTEVLFNGIAVADGMTEIHLLYRGWAPAGSSLMWQVKPYGETEWTTVNEGDPTPLIGLPPSTQLKAVFTNTTDLAACVILDQTARFAAARHRNTMQAVSTAVNFGLSTELIILETTVDNFDPDVNTVTNRLRIGGSFVNATATTVEIDLEKPVRRKVTSSFAVSATTSAVAAPSMTTSNLAAVPFIQNIAMYAE